MKNPTILCAHCQNRLYDSSVVFTSYVGPLLMCSNCRGLYYVDMQSLAPGQYSLAIQTASFSKEEEYDLIRNSTGMIPLSEFMASMKEMNVSSPADTNKDLDIKNIIGSSVTPSDLIRKLNGK